MGVAIASACGFNNDVQLPDYSKVCFARRNAEVLRNRRIRAWHSCANIRLSPIMDKRISPRYHAVGWIVFSSSPQIRLYRRGSHVQHRCHWLRQDQRPVS